MSRAAMFATHHIAREPLSVRDRMATILARLGSDGSRNVEFTSLFTPAEGRAGVVVTLLAILELWRERLIDLVQTGPFAPIHVRGQA